MDRSLIELANRYRDKYSHDSLHIDRLRELHAEYAEKRQASILDAAASTAAVDASFLSDRIDSDSITPAMQEAYDLAFGQHTDLSGMLPDSIGGVVSAWKGKYFEVLLRDRLNSGEWVGDIHLQPGQTAQLATDPTQPGWDLQIINPDGTVDGLLQAKASDSLSYIKEALERYPEIEIVATEEAAVQMADTLINSGITNDELETAIAAPMEELLDTPLAEAAEDIIPGLPIVIIAVSEGHKVMIGRQSFQQAIHHSVERGIQSGISIGTGFLLALADAGIITLPATFLTHVGVSRYRIQCDLEKKLANDIHSLQYVAGRITR